jgi:hypothetical protein
MGWFAPAVGTDEDWERHVSKFSSIIAGTKEGTEIIIHLSGANELRGQVVKLDSEGILELALVGGSIDNLTYVDLDSVAAITLKRDLSDEALIEALQIDNHG